MADLDELRAFLAVVEHGSAKAAADVLGVPRSTLRRQVDALEQRVGAPLLWTDARGTRPSPKGRLMIEEARCILDAHAVLIKRVREFAKDGDE
ncbi:MAG: LysR family transcriptional regulator [Myxococcales bacterium]|nr:LysR family transcriptional regulator [Myxococcales bacterium]